MSLQQYGVSASDIIQAVSKVQAAKLGAYNRPAQNTYIYINNELWDLKPVVGLVLESAGVDINTHKWNSRRYQKELLRLGFPILRFTQEKARNLGIRGYDEGELNDEHKLFWPPSGEEQPNAFAKSQKSEGHSAVRSVNSKVFIRNSELRRRILVAAGGVCQCCKSKTFQTAAGEWFLEVHHKKWLREGGLDHQDNLVALCPNCHRKEHYGIERNFR